MLVKELNNDTRFLVSFLGNKADKNRHNHDFRVDMIKEDRRVVLSHANIILDLFTKGNGDLDLIPDLYIFLGNLIENDTQNWLAGTKILHLYKPDSPPSQEFLTSIDNSIDKNIGIIGNSWVLDISELAVAIKLITLQEDINYPTDQGRKMPYARYLESLYYAMSAPDSISQVVQRAISHSVSQNRLNVDYAITRLAVSI
ncbi:MAG: hypothetical protein IH859_00400 [Chloroflexi bacterium]|nr:hypothetical protein [Chloroflexota bacterium]